MLTHYDGPSTEGTDLYPCGMRAVDEADGRIDAYTSEPERVTCLDCADLLTKARAILPSLRDACLALARAWDALNEAERTLNDGRNIESEDVSALASELTTPATRADAEEIITLDAALALIVETEGRTDEARAEEEVTDRSRA